jgi:hypothetical protein
MFIAMSLLVRAGMRGGLSSFVRDILVVSLCLIQWHTDLLQVVKKKSKSNGAIIKMAKYKVLFFLQQKNRGVNTWR